LPTRLVELFRLSGLEQRLLVQLLVSTAPVAVSVLAERLDSDLANIIALLGPERTLRARALVESEARGLSWPLPSDLFTAGRGLHLYCNESDQAVVEDAALFAGHAPGIGYFAAPQPGTAWAQELLGDKRPAAIVDVVREHLVSAQAVVLSLGGVSAADLMPLCQTLRARLLRPVVVIDGALLAGWPPLEVYAALLRVRRDADLRGAAVVVSDAKQLGSALRALCQPRPAAQTAPVVLCVSDTPLPVGRLPQGGASETPLLPAVASLLRAPAPAAAAAASISAADEKEDPAILASREEARRKAAVDAARAMGRPIPPELNEPPKTVAAPAPRPAATSAAAPSRPSAPIPAPIPPPAPAAPPVEREEMPPGARAVNPRLAAALAKAGLPPAGSTAYQSEEYRRPSRTAAAEPAPSTPAAPLPVPPVAESAEPPAATPGATEPAAEVEDGPPLALEEGAPLEEIIRVARLTPNNAQRLRILHELNGKRAPSVIQLYRTCLTSANAAVRTAAEAGMSSLFGQNWNRSRSIQAPVQPPRSDDGGRGPGGAF
jgi:hypothetical protein